MILQVHIHFLSNKAAVLQGDTKETRNTEVWYCADADNRIFTDLGLMIFNRQEIKPTPGSCSEIISN